MVPAHGAPILVSPTTGERRLARLPLNTHAGNFDEGWLRDLIHRHPACLPVDQIEPGWGDLISVCTELPTPHGPIDNLLITADGNLVLTEVKLWRNPEARRKVVAQALDYASCLFKMNYSQLEAAVKNGREPDGVPPQTLYSLIADADGLEEAEFVDRINTNLRKGRVMLLVAGDGIRTETAQLISLFQAHSYAHFTFGLVELTVYEIPECPDYLVCPRVLAQTEMMSRTVVQIDDQRVTVTHTDPSQAGSAIRPAPQNISAEQFYEAMGHLRANLPARLQAFLDQLETLGVYPDFQRALNLRWDPPEGKPVNLGYIVRAGQVWTECVNWTLPHHLSHRYIENLAAAVGCDVDKDSFRGDQWHLRKGGKAPWIEYMADHFDAWAKVIEGFLADLRRQLADTA